MPMTNRDALEHAMVAIHDRDRITVKGTKAVAKKHVATRVGGKADATKADTAAQRDMEAWNMLRHLSRIL